MKLTPTQLENIVLNNPNADLVNKAKAYNKTMRLHLYGEGMDTHLKTIEGYEKDAQTSLRVAYAKSNKDLFSRLARPIDKVFTARGGSTYYNLGEAQEKQAMLMSMDVREGYNAKKWMETFWKPHFLDDPMGFIFLEIGDGLNMPAGLAYPTYKSISTVFDYQPKGTGLDYVAWELTKEDKIRYGIDVKEQVYRVVDDAHDYLVKKENNKAEVLPQFTLPNFFEQVPAILNSDRVSAENDRLHVSLFDEVVELADKVLIKDSIKNIHDFLHGFPKFWQYGDDCNTCAGSGFNDGKKCSDCGGSGMYAQVKMSDVKLMRYPEKDSHVVTPDVMGYAEPSEIYYNIVTAELRALEDMMNSTLWGIQPKVQKAGSKASEEGTKTATEVIDDQQPLIDRLTSISESAEKRHKFIIDLMVQINLKVKAYHARGGSSVNYGRRYMIESIDQILTRYTSAKMAGLSDESLNDLLTEFIETKYAGDPVGMAITLKLKDVEPFVHNTPDQVEASAIIPSVDKIAKRFFGEWRKKSVNDAMILSLSVEALTDMLYAYAKEQQTKVDAETKQQQEHEINLKTAKADKAA